MKKSLENLAAEFYVGKTLVNLEFAKDDHRTTKYGQKIQKVYFGNDCGDTMIFLELKDGSEIGCYTNEEIEVI